MTDPAMATLLEADGRVALRFVRRFAHPPEKVWRAITESEHLQHWLPCDIVGERAEGAGVELPFWPAHVEAYGLDMTPSLSGEIQVWQPPGWCLGPNSTSAPGSPRTGARFSGHGRKIGRQNGYGRRMGTWGMSSSRYSGPVTRKPRASYQPVRWAWASARTGPS